MMKKKKKKQNRIDLWQHANDDGSAIDSSVNDLIHINYINDVSKNYVALHEFKFHFVRESQRRRY